jgi:hypothetical protein
MEVPMSERCIHVINEITMKCNKCSAPYGVAKSDPRPWNIIRGDKPVKLTDRYEMEDK